MKLTPHQKQKLISIIDSCHTIEQLSVARKWIISLKYDETAMFGELYLLTLQRRNDILKNNLSQIRSSLRNITSILVGSVEREVCEVSPIQLK